MARLGGVWMRQSLLVLILASLLLLQPWAPLAGKAVAFYASLGLTFNLFMIDPNKVKSYCNVSVGTSENEVEETADEGEASKVGLLDDMPISSKDVLGPASGIETSVDFLDNHRMSAAAGELTKIVLGVRNNGASDLKVIFINGSLMLPHDHHNFIQNFTSKEFENATVPSGAHASFEYSFKVHKYMQAGPLDLVATVVYELDHTLHKNVFYNGTVNVVDSFSFLSGETVFLVTFGLGLLGLLGTWLYNQIQKLSKKQRRTNKKVETGTRTTADPFSNEWLQGTSFTQKLTKGISQQRRSRKRK